MPRVLVVDDEPQMLSAYRATMEDMEGDRDRSASSLADLDGMAAELFGQDAVQLSDSEQFDVTYCTQGEEAVEKVRLAIEEGHAYAVVFLDMRMPPGIDGKETAKRVRLLDQHTNIVIVTGYSDHAPHEVARVAGPVDKLFYLSKPFDRVEIRQLASALCARRHMEEELQRAQDAVSEKLRLVEVAYEGLARSEANARHASLHDSLTGLPNRAYFSDQLTGAIERRASLCLLFLDIDKFKNVNDTAGHLAGDQLVCSLGSDMLSAIPTGAVLARLGGDEFGVLLPDIDAQDAASVCARLLDVCSTTREIFGQRLQVSASIGLADVQVDEDRNSSELLRRADMALYVAKRDGGNRFCKFSHDIDEAVRLRRKIELELRDALAREELSLVYQPIVKAGTGRTVAYEALVRWSNADLATISPAVFIPIAEESGLILTLGRWVIHHALRECSRWDDEFISINLSPAQFEDPGLEEFLIQECRDCNVDPHLVQLEITETALFADIAKARRTIEELRAHGFRFALDDFGTGYSSLGYLMEFPLDCIKIDRSFVATVATDHNAEAIVRSVVSLANALNMSLIAEGVEDALQEQALKRAGCELMQGFHLGTPAEAPSLLRAQLQPPCSAVNF